MTNETNAPLIIGFVSDLMFTTRIDNVARHIGYRMEWLEDADQVGPEDVETIVKRPGEALHGRDGKLFEQITAWQPALLLFDLTNTAIPWRKWIAVLKSSPATRRIPIMCFGPHEDVETMQAAKSAGADVVLARSRFTSDMPALFQKYARIFNEEMLRDTCREPLPPLAVNGIELYNQGEYYKCHDDLEEAWMADQSKGRDLYRGILQAGIALYQVERGNYRGAVKMLLRVRQWLDPLPATCRGVDVAGLRQNVQTFYDEVTKLGPDHLDDFNWDLIQPISYEA